MRLEPILTTLDQTISVKNTEVDEIDETKVSNKKKIQVVYVDDESSNN